MAFTDRQAKAKAQQIFDRYGQLIHDACVGTGVRESFLAGFTGVEAGIDRQGNIKPNATRFEPGVYQDLISLRDNGYCFINGKKRSTYSGVERSQIADADDAAIRALSTSYSFSQIMGWHIINNLHCTIADLRDTDKHFHYTVQLLKIVGGHYMRDGDLTAVLHIWNTGNANGKTYHGDYVANALKVAKFYEGINVGSPFVSAGAITTEDSAAGSGSSGRETADLAAAESALTDPAGGSNNSNGQTQPPILPSNKDGVVVEKEENAGFFKKIKIKLGMWLTSLGGLTGIQQYKETLDGIGLPGWVLIWVLGIAGICFLGWLAYEGYDHLRDKDRKRLLTVTLVKANSTATNLVVTACPEDLAKFEAEGWTIVRRG